MGDFIMWSIISLTMIVLVIAYFVIDFRLRNVKTVDEQVKDCLKKSGKVEVNMDNYASMVAKNNKKMIFLLILMFAWVFIMFLLGLLRIENIVSWIWFCILIFVMLIIPVILLTLRDIKKFKITDDTYRIQAYVREVHSARSSTYAYFVYYDYIREKHIVLKRVLSQEERTSQSIVRSYYAKILVNEKRNRLQFLAFDYS